MFTSRAEFRLSLRADNADQRLTPLGLSLGCVGADRRATFEDKMERLDSAKTALQSHSLTPKEARSAGLKVSEDGTRRSGMDLLAFPDIDFARLAEVWPELEDIAPEIRRQVECDALYANYIERQKNDVAAMRRDEAQEIPADFDYAAVNGLSHELRGKLEQVRPRTLAQAGRIDGMTPAALTLILSRLRQNAARRTA